MCRSIVWQFIGQFVRARKKLRGLCRLSRISWHVGGHVRSESNHYRGIEKASRRHVEALLWFWPLVFQYLDPEDLVVWRLYA